jgi:hypothetical protein
MPADGIHYKFPARDHNLFVCEADPLAGAYCGPGGRESGDANDRRHYRVGLWSDSDADQSVRAVQQFGNGSIRDSKIGKPRTEAVDVRRFLNDRNFRSKLLNLLREQVDISSRSKSEHPKSIWILTDDIQGVGSDGTRGTKDGKRANGH